MYKSSEAKKLLNDLYGWQEYGLKHEESVWTKWFQNFYLYNKFGIDKRKAHYASLINSGQMTRKEAMDLLLVNPVYPELGIERKVMSYPRISHDNFKKDKWYGRISKLVKLWKSMGITSHQ
jgi:hypothetical protein